MDAYRNNRPPTYTPGMCLFALAHRASKRFPLVIAANRDEDYGRPTLEAGFWDDAPGIVGGRDALHGGSWLAIDRHGRFAAVTNLRGSYGVTGKLSRGNLVRDFVAGSEGPLEYAQRLEAKKDEYAGFHLVTGIAVRDAALLSGTAALLEPGVHALSNAEPGVRWPKVEKAEAEMSRLLTIEDAGDLCGELMTLLTTPAADPPADPTREIFIAGEQYGTRSSTVIVVDRDGETLFVEESFGRGGEPLGEPRVLLFTLRE